MSKMLSFAKEKKYSPNATGRCKNVILEIGSITMSKMLSFAKEKKYSPNATGQCKNVILEIWSITRLHALTITTFSKWRLFIDHLKTGGDTKNS